MIVPMKRRTLTRKAASRWAVIVLLMSLLLTCYLGLRGVAFRDGYVNGWMIVAAAGFVLALGLWARRPWARPLGLVLLMVAFGLTAAHSVSAGFAWWQPIGFAALVGGFWLVLRWRIPPDEGQQRPLMSLVLLFREPVYLEPQTLARVASRAWDADIQIATEEDGDEPLGTEQARSMLVGQSPHFFCSHWPGLFLIHNVDAPYFDDPDAVAESVREIRVRQAIEQHQAWIAVDVVEWFGSDDQSGRRQAYRLIAKLLAELADENCLAVVEPGEGRAFLYDPTTEEKLRSDDPLDALRDWYYPPVLAIEADDPQLQAAVSEARRRWPEFVAAFETRHDQHGDDEPPFLVKAPFTDGEHVEYMWVRVTGIENQVIYGVLENTPANVRSVAEGQRVRVRLDNLNDWMCILEGRPAGAFTLQVLANKSRQDEKPD
jgi:uncharacterized protein YegJ (DUF2314 family)